MRHADLTVLVPALLAAAVLHATWNGLGKLIPDRLGSAALIGLTNAVIGAICAPFLPVPHPGAWPFLIASAVVQSGYLLLLMSAYRVGDFGQVYPLARGISPLLVTLVSLTVVGDRLAGAQFAGVLVVSVGLIGLVFVDGLPRAGTGSGLAVLTGIAIACYSLLDGVGVRHSGSPIGYAMWLFLLQGPIIPLIAWRRRRHRLVGSLRPYWRKGVLGGVLSLASYGTVVVAQAHAPLAAVATLRETSIVFAALIGRFVFAEPYGSRRAVASVVIAVGIVVLSLG